MLEVAIQYIDSPDGIYLHHGDRRNGPYTDPEKAMRAAAQLTSEIRRNGLATEPGFFIDPEGCLSPTEETIAARAAEARAKNLQAMRDQRFPPHASRRGRPRWLKRNDEGFDDYDDED